MSTLSQLITTLSCLNKRLTKADRTKLNAKVINIIDFKYLVLGRLQLTGDKFLKKNLELNIISVKNAVLF